MQRILTATCIATAVYLIACSGKKEITRGAGNLPHLTGTWELREAQNGMMPTALYAAGNGTQWKFSATAFEQYNNGNRVRSGSYSLVPDTTASEAVGLVLPEGQFTHRLVLEGDSTEKTFVDVRGDTLEMVQGFFPVDAGSRQVYVKIGGSQ